MSEKAYTQPDIILSPERRKQTPVTVIYGGNSSERAGSMLSGQTAMNLLIQAGYAHVQGYDLTSETLRALPPPSEIGVAFLTLHGGAGEDGTVQGYLNMLGIPHTGCDVAASAICQDKAVFSSLVSSYGYNTPGQTVVPKNVDITQMNFNFPVVGKPRNGGCSYGVFLAQNMEELVSNYDFTRKFGDMVVEDFIPGREFSIGIFEDPKTGKPHVLPIVEVILHKGIQDFETKYPGGEELYEEILPAVLDPDVQHTIEAACADIFTRLGCRGYSRMDFRMAPDGTIYWLENNTSPGLIGEESDFPKMLVAGGVTLPDFADMMVEAALIHYREAKEEMANLPGEVEMCAYLGIPVAD